MVVTAERVPPVLPDRPAGRRRRAGRAVPEGAGRQARHRRGDGRHVLLQPVPDHEAARAPTPARATTPTTGRTGWPASWRCPTSDHRRPPGTDRGAGRRGAPQPQGRRASRRPPNGTAKAAAGSLRVVAVRRAAPGAGPTSPRSPRPSRASTGSNQTFKVCRFIWNDFGLDEAEGYPIVRGVQRPVPAAVARGGQAGARRKWDEAVKSGPGPEGRRVQARGTARPGDGEAGEQKSEPSEVSDV